MKRRQVETAEFCRQHFVDELAQQKHASDVDEVQEHESVRCAPSPAPSCSVRARLKHPLRPNLAQVRQREVLTGDDDEPAYLEYD